MFLSEVKIKNFRIFQDFELKLNEGMNLIVGENNSGKTALIDAIRYTLGTTSGEWVNITNDDFHKNEKQFSIQLKFDGIKPEQASVFVEHLTHELIKQDTDEDKADKKAKRKSVLYINFEATLTDQTRRGYRIIKTDIKSGEKADGIRIEKEIRDYLSATYLKPLRDAKAELAAGRGSRLSQILSVTSELEKDSANFEELLNALIDANKAIIENPGIKSNKKRIENQLQKLIFENDTFNLAIDILGGHDVSGMSDIEKDRTFKAILEKLNLLLDAENPLQGLGYNNLLFVATELLLLGQEQDDFPLLLIEEPEAHLHPQLQMRLLKFIRDEYSKGNEPALQSILTTHSPNLASKAPLESLIFMSKNGKAFSLRKGETELNEDDYIFLEKFLDVTKSNLFFAKAVLMVEGDGENILLPTIAELLDRPLENYGVSVVNIGSTAFARYAKIFQRKGLDKDTCEDKYLPVKVACIRDLDLWPEKARKSDNNPLGFKEWKDKNQRKWLSYYKDKPQELKKYKDKIEAIKGQRVKVYVSDVWTFEYSLALNGLAKEVHYAKTKSTENFNALPKNSEEKAIEVYRLIEKSKAKTEVAYQLAKNLKKEYTGKKELLIKKLPQYIIDAIGYVTESIKIESTNNEDNDVIPF